MSQLTTQTVQFLRVKFPVPVSAIVSRSLCRVGFSTGLKVTRIYGTTWHEMDRNAKCVGGQLLMGSGGQAPPGWDLRGRRVFSSSGHVLSTRLGICLFLYTCLRDSAFQGWTGRGSGGGGAGTRSRLKMEDGGLCSWVGSLRVPSGKPLPWTCVTP